MGYVELGFTQRLARFASASTFGDLPPEVVDISKNMMIDAAAVGLAGAAQPEGRALIAFVQEMRGNGKCTIIWQGLRTTPVNAALANGTVVRLLDFDDEIAGRDTHPSSVVFPVVMALGEMNGDHGQEVLNAFALGCEVTSNLALSGRPSEEATTANEDRVWHREGVAATIGAAVAASRLLGLGQEQTENAIGMANEGAGGIHANSASPSAALQYGRAAMNGITAALLAQRGFADSGPRTEAPPIEDEDGFFRRLANPYHVVQPGVTFKVYPCHSASHTSIEAVLQLTQQYRIEPGQIESVKVRLDPSMSRALPFHHPQSAWEAKRSLEYSVAAALLSGQPLLEQYTDNAVQSPEIEQMMRRVAVEPVAEANPLLAGASTVTLGLSGGRQLEHRVELARGRPELALDREELDAKFLYCSRYILPPDHIEGAIEQFRDLENVKDITGLASILGG